MLYKDNTKHHTYIMFLFIVGAIAGVLITTVHKKRQRKPKPIETLKNALLTYALMTVNYADFDTNYDYKSYDGSKLPSMSGVSLTSSCFSYITDINDLCNRMFYTPQMMLKLQAIQRYLDANFDTTEKTIDFFDNFAKDYDTCE